MKNLLSILTAIVALATSCGRLAIAADAALPTTRPFQITANVPSGIYELNEQVVWTVDWSADSPPPAASYSILAGQVKSISDGELAWAGKRATVRTAAISEPGTLLLKIKFPGIDLPGLGGVVVAPKQIKPVAPKPADFDAFWTEKLNELAGVDAEPKLVAGDSRKADVDYWQITMNNIRGIKIRGQLARPHAAGKRPALLIVQWAGVYGLDQSWVTDRAAQGFLALNISAHDLPIDQPPPFYKEQFDGPLKDYWAIGNDDRDSSYFLHMYLSCFRAVEYLSHREDWDGKTLVVMGGSQGGQQALLTAAVHPEQITAALANVPASCDVLGPTVGRKGGWPQWYDITWGGRDAAKVREAGRYYDIVNFTPRIRCPVLIGLGLLDEVCPAAGIFAAANQITSPTQILAFPAGGHQDENNSHGLWNKAVWEVWLPSLARGVVPTVNASRQPQ